jgi:hypothetical protein
MAGAARGVSLPGHSDFKRKEVVAKRLAEVRGPASVRCWMISPSYDLSLPSHPWQRRKAVTG